MADVRIHLTAAELEEFGETVDMLRKLHDEFESGENADPYEFYGALGVVVDHANAVLAWVSQVKTATAHQSIAA